MKKLMISISLFLLILSLITCSKKNMFYGLDAEDTIGPAIWVDSPASGSTIGGKITIIGHAKDSGGDNTVQKIEVSIDNGSSWQIAAGSLNWSYVIDTFAVWGGNGGSKTFLIRATDTDYKHNKNTLTVTYIVNNSNPDIITADIKDSNDTVNYNGTTCSDNSCSDGYRNSAEGNVLKYVWANSASVQGYEIAIFNVTDSKSDIFIKDVPALGATVSYSGIEINGGTANQGTITTGASSISFTRDTSNNIIFQYAGLNGKKYYITVKAYDSAGTRSSQKVSMQETIDTIAPPTQTNFKVNNQGSGAIFNTRTVLFTWDASTDGETAIRYYQIDTNNDGIVDATFPGDITQIPYTFSADGTYTVNVRAMDMAGNTSATWTAISNIVISSGLPASVGAISDTSSSGYYNSITGAAITFSWTDVLEKGYDIQVLRLEDGKLDFYSSDTPASGVTTNLANGAATGVTAVDIIKSGATVYFDFTALSGYHYQVQVKAYNAASSRSPDWKTSNSVYVDTSIPSAGTVFDTIGSMLGLGAFTSSSLVNFNWTGFSDTGSGIAKYLVQTKVGLGAWSASADIGLATAYSYDFTSAANNQMVYLRVAAVDNAGNQSAWAQSDGITIYLLINNVGAISDNGGAGHVRNNASGDRVLTYTWTDLSDAIGYNITINEAVNSKSDGVTALKAAGALGNGSNTGITSVSLNTAAGITTFQFTAPADNAKYYISVKGYDSAGNYSSAPAVSNTILVDITLPFAGTVLDTITSAGGLGVYSTTSSVIFSWSGYLDADTGIKKYWIQTKVGAGAWSASTDLGLATAYSYDFGGGNAGQIVSARIMAEDYAGNQSLWGQSDGITLKLAVSNVGAISDNGGTGHVRNNTSGDRVLTYTWTDLNTSPNDAAGYYVTVYETVNSQSDSYTALKAAGNLANGTNTGITSVSLNTAAGTTYFQFTAPSDNKKYYIAVKGYDSAGNYSSAFAYSTTIAVDITNPDAVTNLQVNGASGQVYYNSITNPVYITWNLGTDTGLGVDYYQVDLNGDSVADGADNCGKGVPSICNGMVTNVFGTEGNRAVKVRAVDKAGNTGPWSTAVNLFVDVTPPNQPVVTAFNDTNAGANDAKIQVYVRWSNAGDNAGGSGIKYYKIMLIRDDTKDPGEVQVNVTNDVLTGTPTILYNTAGIINGTTVGVVNVATSPYDVWINMAFTGKKCNVNLAAVDQAGNTSIYSLQVTSANNVTN